MYQLIRYESYHISHTILVIHKASVISSKDMRRRVIDPANRRTSVEHRRPSLSILSLDGLAVTSAAVSHSRSQDTLSKNFLFLIYIISESSIIIYTLIYWKGNSSAPFSHYEQGLLCFIFLLFQKGEFKIYRKE